MQTGFRLYKFLMIPIMLMFLSGCSVFFMNRPTQEAVQEKIQEARKHIEVVNTLEIEESYQDDIETAETLIENAEKHIKWRRTTAYEEAEKSLEISGRILREFYLNTVAELAKKAKEELARKTKGDEDDPLTDYIPKLDEVMDQAREVKEDRQVVSLDMVIDDLKEILQVNFSIQTSLTKTLESDVSFDKGSYELSEEGNQALEKMIGSIIADREKYLGENPDKLVVMKIKVVGYTDRLHFIEGSDLMKELLKGIEDQAPQDQPARREFLNQRLSELRAEKIAGYIEKFVSETYKEDTRFRIDTKSVGRGESIPANVPPPYPVMDSRRRICKIYTYTVIHEQ